jgi:hypothetical protein
VEAQREPGASQGVGARPAQGGLAGPLESVDPEGLREREALEEAAVAQPAQVERAALERAEAREGAEEAAARTPAETRLPGGL